MTRLRSQRRLAAIVAAAIVLSAVIAFLYPGRGARPASIGTAYAAFVLIAAALVMGPLNVLQKKSNPVHSALRRDVGISAGVMSLLHTLLGLQVHMRGNLARYFVPPAAPTHATDMLFVATNWIGLAAVIAIVVVTLISNNRSLRWLGLHKWKMFQRLVYPAAILVVLHGFAYQALEKRSVPAIVFVALLSVFVVGFQIAGMAANRRYSSRTS